MQSEIEDYKKVGLKGGVKMKEKYENHENW
jgi:hypothetical protein